ncbi:MAG: hypothetical protein LBD14_02105 [Puniceicoccales bacterium]|jgi:hypothetical protein|nr:hypothetical protein [Puniceicoccales bacterium]
MKSSHHSTTKAHAFGKSALFAAALSAASVCGLQADDTVTGTREFKEAKELDGEGTLWIARDSVLKFTGEKATIERIIEIQPSGRRRHGFGIIEVANPKAELTVKVLLGNNEYGVFRRTEKRGPGTLILSGDEDNSGAKLVVREGTVVLAKASDNGTHAQGGTGFLEIYGDKEKGTLGTLRIGGTGGDQIADDGNIIINGGVLDCNTHAESVNSLSATDATFQFAFGGAAGKTGTLSVTGEEAFSAKGKNTVVLASASSWAAGRYDLFVASEEIPNDYFKTFSLSDVPNGKLELDAKKKTIQLVIEKK